MKMKEYILLLVILLTFGLGACEEKDPVTATDLAGSWFVNEVGGNYDGYYYEVKITVDPENSSRIFVSNFLNTANDPESTVLNYMLVARVEGNRLVVDPQQVDVVEIMNSTGYVNDKNQFRLDYRYALDNNSYLATAYFIRN